MEDVLSRGVATRFAEQDWTGISADSLIHRAKVNLKTSGLLLACHFEDESALMLHYILERHQMPDIPVIYLKLPDEKPRFMRALVGRFKPNLRVIKVLPGEGKRQALNRAVKKFSADGVLFGIHRYQSDNRATKKLVEYDDTGSRPFCRLHPALEWGPKWVSAYFATHNLPYPEGHFPGTRIKEKECDLHCPFPKQAVAP